MGAITQEEVRVPAPKHQRKPVKALYVRQDPFRKPSKGGASDVSPLENGLEEKTDNFISLQPGESLETSFSPQFAIDRNDFLLKKMGIM